MDLVADIGATNARFQYAQDGQLWGTPAVLPTADFSVDVSLLEAALAALDGPPVQRTLLAVAGPVTDGQAVQVTNTGLMLHAQACAEVVGGTVGLVNDFFALAHGVPHFQRFVQLGGGEPRRAVKAVLGPGTGLGMATLLPGADADSGWLVAASEGGHADLAPGSHLEAELWGLLTAEHGHVCWETVLCGSGLQRLYSAMSALWGSRPQALSAEQISAQGQNMADPVCHQTLETFCSLLGAAAGNLALTVAATGGVYLAGGIVPSMLEFVQASPLRRRFEERGEMSGFVEQIPLLIITEENPGLSGAAWCLAQQTL